MHSILCISLANNLITHLSVIRLGVKPGPGCSVNTQQTDLAELK